MKTKNIILKKIAFFMAGAMLFTSCASTTMIHSIPSGTKLYLDGEPVGTTPYVHTDTKIVGSTTMVRMEKEGYNPFIASFSRNEEADIGAIIGGIFVLVPFLWTIRYKPEHHYELIPASEKREISSVGQEKSEVAIKTKAEKLKELKQLHDENLISKEEYEKARKKVLDE